jgi:hypothetical protein
MEVRQDSPPHLIGDFVPLLRRSRHFQRPCKGLVAPFDFVDWRTARSRAASGLAGLDDEIRRGRSFRDRPWPLE